jgi:polyisoprenoid-binding protein YceI
MQIIPKDIILYIISLILLPGYSTVAGSPDRYVFSVSDASTAYYEARIKLMFVTNSTITGINDNVSGELEWIPAEPKPYVDARIVIDANGFESGNGTRDRDVRNYLKAAEYPEIIFALKNILGLQADIPKSASGSYAAVGELTVAGTTSEITVPVTIRFSTDTLYVDGSTAATYTQFGVDPPRVAGIVGRAPDELRLGMNLIFIRNE